MVYLACVLTVIAAWILNRTGMVGRLTPRVELAGIDIGFYLLHGLLFAMITVPLLLWDRRRSILLHRKPSGLALRHDQAKPLDLLVVAMVVVCAIAMIGANFISHYLIGVLFLGLFAAFESLARRT